MKQVSSAPEHEEGIGETASQRQKPSPTPVDPTLNTREWATLKRVLPRDVFHEVVRFEELVATHSGMPARFQGLGQSISVWSVICECLRNREDELIALAKEWKGENG